MTNGSTRIAAAETQKKATTTAGKQGTKDMDALAEALGYDKKKNK